MTGRVRLPSPGQSEEEEEDEGLEREVLSEDCHVYQSLERQGLSPSRGAGDDIYTKIIKQGAVQSEGGEEEMDDSLDIDLPQEEIEVERPVGKPPMPTLQQRPSSVRSLPSPDEDTSAHSPKANHGCSKKKAPQRSSGSRRDADAEFHVSAAYQEVVDMQKEMVRGLTEQNQGLLADRRALEQRCAEQSMQLQRSHERLQELELELTEASAQRDLPAGDQAELLSLQQQGQELVDENDRLRMMVHRLNVELSRYQTRFRPLSKDESSRTGGLPMKGSAPPWLLDMKYLSPLLLAYEDRLNEKDTLLQSAEDDLRGFRQRVEEVVHENERLHKELGTSGVICQKEWKQLQQQARLVLQENQVLIQQLELQHSRAKEGQSQQHAEVTKVSKQLMLLEAENQRLGAELDAARGKLRTLQAEHLQVRASLEQAVSWDEHCAITTKLKRQLEQKEAKKESEVKDLLEKMACLQADRRGLVLEKTELSAGIKNKEAELELSRQANRKAQRKIVVLKQQIEDSTEKQMTANHYLASMLTLAEKTTQERDQLIHMASSLEQDKHGVLGKVVDGTLRLGKLQEKVKVYKQQAAASLLALGQRLTEQEDDFAGKAACYQRHIQHLQRLLRDKQDDLDGVLQQKREVEGELEVVWQAATQENQRIREALLASGPSIASPGLAREHRGASPSWPSPGPRPESSGPPPFASRQSGALKRSPMFESDSDQHQNPSSDESEKNAMDFYS